jgi:hypothetical protein
MRVWAGRITISRLLKSAQKLQLTLFRARNAKHPSKFRLETSGREGGVDAAIVPGRGLFAVTARRSAEIRGAMGSFASSLPTTDRKTPGDGA